ncbi:hypothetical protein D5R81_04635 [Parashewanella spongiae]|uniref:Secreted protein n=1 Tax=Parashewanella spongiae TaxID=342950 RepID=A0A3A6U9I8_9GAMM|nr:hypothetical protein [Parashewanella spongiae]MCL1077311.1 hypothetical protein [Parashewanella spongiae]RJY18602.1 hypothetical protein D5R81_04635 [Parashewanella spongiae]
MKNKFIKQKVVLCLLLGVVPFAQAEISCVASYQYYDGSSWQHETEDMPENFNAGNIQKFDADRQEAYYSVLINTQMTEKGEADIILSITFPPDYIKGTTSEFLSNEQSDYMIAHVDGDTVYKVECNKP